MKNDCPAKVVTSIEELDRNIQQGALQQELFAFTTKELPPDGFNPENPRHFRAVTALLSRGLFRSELDSIAGAANGPDLMAQIGKKNAHWTCKRVEMRDRDHRVCRVGFYELTPAGREALAKAIREV